MRTIDSAFVAAALLLGSAAPAGAQTIDQARALYAAAEYPEALAALRDLEKDAAPARMRDILEYRALCLLALGRGAESEQAVERLVTTDPTYAPDEVERPPQLRAIVRTVRERQLPVLARQRYAAAKALLDAGDSGAAAEAFEGVLGILGFPETVTGLGAEDAADLRTLAASFRDLASSRTLRERPADTAAAAAPGTASAPRTAAGSPAASSPPAARLYDATDGDVVAPVPIEQQLPPFRVSSPLKPQLGLLVLIIDENGRVESAALNVRIHPAYDRQLLERARAWRYEPATLNGRAVRFRRLMEVRVATN